jgi:hypothetical protein
MQGSAINNHLLEIHPSVASISQNEFFKVVAVVDGRFYSVFEGQRCECVFSSSRTET